MASNNQDLQTKQMRCAHLVLTRSATIRLPNKWKEIQFLLIGNEAIQHNYNLFTEEEFFCSTVKLVLQKWWEMGRFNIKKLLLVLEKRKLFREADKLRAMLELRPKNLPADDQLTDEKNQDAITKYILDHIDDLAFVTSSNHLLEFLRQQQILTSGSPNGFDEDDEDVDKSVYLYEKVAENPLHLNKLIMFLENYNNTRAAWVLRRVFHELPNFTLNEEECSDEEFFDSSFTTSEQTEILYVLRKKAESSEKQSPYCMPTRKTSNLEHTVPYVA